MIDRVEVCVLAILIGLSSSAIGVYMGIHRGKQIMIQEAISHGCARYEITDAKTGATEFRWIAEKDIELDTDCLDVGIPVTRQSVSIDKGEK